MSGKNKRRGWFTYLTVPLGLLEVLVAVWFEQVAAAVQEVPPRGTGAWRRGGRDRERNITFRAAVVNWNKTNGTSSWLEKYWSQKENSYKEIDFFRWKNIIKQAPFLSNAIKINPILVNNNKFLIYNLIGKLSL